MPILRLFLSRLLITGLFLATSSCARSPRTDLDGVVLIVVDTLRADRLGFMGYPDATTPHLDALAKRGRVFTQAMTPVPVTLPAVTSLLTGTTPLAHGVRDNEGFVLTERPEGLPLALRRAGWRTGAVVGAAVLAADRGMDRGFEDYDDDFVADHFPVYREDLRPLAEPMQATRRRASVVTDRARAWLEQDRGRPFFLFVHYFDAHAPYDPPPAFAAAHPGEPYDGAIAATDAAIGRLLKSLPERTLVAFVADHGEGLGEHDEAEHGFLLYQSTLHVPLVLAGPDVQPGKVETPVSLIDVAPTLAAACGTKGLPDAEGVALDLGPGAEQPPSRQLYAETLRPLIAYGWQDLRALREGSLKLIAGHDRFELYDLASDAGETLDRAQISERTADLAQILGERVGEDDAEGVRRAARAHVAADPDRSEQLRSLGYVGEAGDADPPGARPHPGDALPRWNQRQRDRVSARVAARWVDEGRFEPARSLLDSLLSRHPDRADLLYERSRARGGLGNREGSRQDLEASLRADPLFPPSLRARAQQLIEAERFGEAVVVLDRLLRSRPDDADAQYNLGVALLRSGEPTRAEQVLQFFVDRYPDDARSASVRQWLSGEGRP